jgi:hypothetical protein
VHIADCLDKLCISILKQKEDARLIWATCNDASADHWFHGFCDTFIHLPKSFVCLYSFIYSSTHVLRSFITSLIHSFICLFQHIYSFIHSFIDLHIYSFIHSCMHPFIQTIIRWCWWRLVSLFIGIWCWKNHETNLKPAYKVVCSKSKMRYTTGMQIKRSNRR